MASEVGFRQLFSRSVDCVKMFFICRPCYRGQAYCSDPCRRKTRLLQQRKANRRYQADPEVRGDHRNSQREYRNRLREGRRIDPSSTLECGSTISEPLGKTEPESPPAKQLQDPPKPIWRKGFGHVVCIICGRGGKFVAAFVHRE